MQDNNVVNPYQDIQVNSNSVVDPFASFISQVESDGGFNHEDVVEPELIVDVTVVESVDVSDKGRVFVSEGNGGLTTDIALVSASAQLVESTSFNDTLAHIPATALRVNSLLAAYRTNPDAFVDDHDSDELDELLREISSISAFAGGVKAKRKDIKQYFDGVRDEALTYLDARLTDAGFDDLVNARSDIRQLKADVSAHRINKRWLELEDTFKANLQQYPLISTLAPSLLDFSLFKIRNASLVSGAKTKKVTKGTHTKVNDILFGWNTGLVAIQGNIWGLNGDYLSKMLTGYVNDPTIHYVTETGQAYKRQQDAEIERERVRLELLEKERIAETERQAEFALRQQAIVKQQAEAAKLQSEQSAKEAAQKAEQLQLDMQRAALAEVERRREIDALANQYVAPQMRESFPRIIDYIFANEKYRNIHNNARVKASLIYDLSQQMAQAGSLVHQETNMDPEKVLELIRFVLDA